MARTGGDGPKGISALLVEAGSPGLSFGAQERKMGWKAQPTAQVQLDACPVPADNLLGAEGDGFRYAMAGLDGGRLNIAAAALGGAQAALDKALAYTAERRAFGQPSATSRRCSSASPTWRPNCRPRASSSTRPPGSSTRRPPTPPRHCAMAKRLVTDTAFRVANDALQLLGGYGYLADYGIEKIVRDLRVHQILEGTNEIMRVIVARALLGGAPRWRSRTYADLSVDSRAHCAPAGARADRGTPSPSALTRSRRRTGRRMRRLTGSRPPHPEHA